MITIPRIARNNLNSSFFHVIIQGHRKEYIFQKKKYIKKYIEIIKKYLGKYQIKIIAFCIMNNHAHFLIKVEKIEELSKFMHQINFSYAAYYNYMEEGRVGHVYRDRFLSEPITTKRYLIQCIKYIHFNPVKAKIVDNCKDYKYSSYNYFCRSLIQNKFIEELSKEDYENICKNIDYNITFLDVDNDIKEKILLSTQEFVRIKEYKLYEIFSNKQILKELIEYLKNNKSIKYVAIREYFEMTKNSMQKIMKKEI